MSDAPFEAFVREYQDMVFATAVRLLGREAEAEDVAQTVFMRAFERFAELASNPAAAGWLKIGIGCLWMLQDPEKQMWHDKIAGTLVVKAPREVVLA